MKQAAVGDWVCFQQLSCPVYGMVLYVNVRDGVCWIMTTSGECRDADVLEVRKKGKP